MKLYKDSNLKEEVSTLDFGIVSAGEKKIFTYYVYNEVVNAELHDIKFSIDHKEVTIVDFPSVLKPKEQGKLTIEWAPSVTIKEGLKTLLKFQASELIS